MLKNFIYFIVCSVLTISCLKSTTNELENDNDVIAPITLDVKLTSDVLEVGYYTSVLTGSFELICSDPYKTFIGAAGFIFSQECEPSFDNSTEVYALINDSHGSGIYYGALLQKDNFSEMIFLHPGQKYYYRSFVTVLEEDRKEVSYFSDVKQLTTKEIEEYVDLGLKSIWPSLNVGAEHTYDAGPLFAYGENEPKSEYTWENYKWKEELEAGLDVNGAINNAFYDSFPMFREGWRLPRESDFQDIVRYCEVFFTPDYYKPGGIIARRGGKELLLNRCWAEGRTSASRNIVYPEDPLAEPTVVWTYYAPCFVFTRSFDGRISGNMSHNLIYSGLPLRLVRDRNYETTSHE